MGSGYAQTTRRFTNGHLAKIVAQDLSGVCRIKNHAPPFSDSRSVIVLIVDQNRILAFKSKRQPPVAAHRHRPMALEVSFQRVQTTSCGVHIFGSSSHVERSQQPPESFGMFWLDPRLRTSLGEFPEPFMPVTEYHLYSVWLQYTQRNRFPRGGKGLSSPWVQPSPWGAARIWAASPA
jgi:hypothetical protein